MRPATTQADGDSARRSSLSIAESFDTSHGTEITERFDRILRELGPGLRRVAGIYEFEPGRRDDLFQEFCLALWQALPRFRGECSETTFAFRIAHNRGLTHAVRRRKREAVSIEAAAEVADPGPTPEAEATRAQSRLKLQEAVLALPLRLRQVVTLALEGMGPKEIGEVLGISEGNAAVRMSRARSALRAILDRPGKVP